MFDLCVGGIYLAKIFDANLACLLKLHIVTIIKYYSDTNILSVSRIF